MTMTYRYTKDKYVICKGGVYFALTKAQVDELQNLLADMQAGTKMYYKEDARRG